MKMFSIFSSKNMYKQNIFTHSIKNIYIFFKSWVSWTSIFALKKKKITFIKSGKRNTMILVQKRKKKDKERVKNPSFQEAKTEKKSSYFIFFFLPLS